MLREEFLRLLEDNVTAHYRRIERAYMGLGDNIQKREFTELFFKKALEWVDEINERHEELASLERRQAELLQQIEAKKAELEALAE